MVRIAVWESATTTLGFQSLLMLFHGMMGRWYPAIPALAMVLNPP